MKRFPGAVAVENEKLTLKPRGGFATNQLHRELVSWFSVPERG
jgi:hypothetical protein